MITGEIDPGPGHQGDQPGDEVQWLENHLGGAVGVGCFELIAYLSVAGQGQALGGHGRSCNITAQTFQFVTLVGFGSHAGVGLI